MLNEQAGKFPERLGGVRNPVERAFEIGDAEAFLHLAGQIDEGGGTDHHRRLRPVGGGDIMVSRVAGDAGANAHAELFKQRLHHPEFAGQVELAENVDVIGRDVVRLLGADHMVEQRLAGQLVAEVLRADEARRVDRHHGKPELLRRAAADGLDIVADQRGDAGRIDEDRRRGICVRNLADRLEQLLLALSQNDVELGQVCRERGAPEIRPRGRRPAVVPGIALAGERRMDQMGDIGDRLQHDLRAVKGAAAGRRPRRQRLGTALLARLGVLALVLVATGLVEHVVDLCFQRHWRDPCPNRLRKGGDKDNSASAMPASMR